MPETTQERRQRIVDAILWSLVAITMFFGLWSGSLLNTEDALYADMARTAWRSGDFLDFRWHGVVLYEKPPVLFLLVGGLGGIFGFSDFS